jgi:diguanylate cyclase (GGDEF)-like protein
VIQLVAPPKGVDLSEFRFVRIWVRYDGPQTQQQVRLYLRNFNPAYSKLGDNQSLKTHEIVLDPTRSKNPIDVDMSKFSVASWWISEHNLPVEHAGVELSNIALVQVGTGNDIGVGLHRISVERIEFHGKWVSSATFRLAVLGLWMLGLFCHVVADGVAIRRRLRETEKNQLSLQRINEALRLRTRDYAKRAGLDPLTGILNRQGLGDELMRLSKRSDVRLFPMSVVFMDIDHFKSINDRNGHAVGDKVIQSLAGLTRNQIQRSDLFARWGGEEFLLLCPLTSPQDAKLIAERLRRAIAAGDWPAGLHVTTTFGVAESLRGEDLSEGIAHADAAMYCAKRNGRDRVEVYAPAASELEEATA